MSTLGARVLRLEDQALVTGRGRFVDDIAAADVLVAAFARSPHPHATIRSIDLTAARAIPGVIAVLKQPRRKLASALAIGSLAVSLLLALAAFGHTLAGWSAVAG